jgi:hypothetical protein
MERWLAVTTVAERFIPLFGGELQWLISPAITPLR